MKFRKRATIYIILALGGLGLIVYLGYLLIEVDRFGRGNEAKFVLLAIACAIFIATISNLMIAMALTFGRVSEVVGMQSCATLYRDGEIIQTSARIRWVNNLDFDNSDLNPDEKVMIFLAGWRPASCTERRFSLRES